MAPRVCILAMVLLFQPGGCFAAGPPMEPMALHLPQVALDPGMQAAMARFKDSIRMAAQEVHSPTGGTTSVLAPAGGSKIRPMAETDADELVILSWERPGTPASILHSFGHQAGLLASVLQAAGNSGSMSTGEVDQVPVAAQILGLIGIELAAGEVAVDYYLPEGAPVDFSTGERLLSLWDGPPVTEADVPLLTVFSFPWQGRPRRILFYSWRLTPDTDARRDSLPVADLRRLKPRGFDWGYLSADGLMFFSALPDNHGLRADRQLLDALVPGGLVVLDYPLGAWCHQPYDAGGFQVMGGRAPLEDWGLRLVRNIPVTEPVFGYRGITKNDKVCVYQKPSAKVSLVHSAPLDFTRFITIGVTRRFVLN
jgi:hypothetical protein